MALKIRSRLTLWYTAVLLIVLVLFGAWVYVVESRLRIASIDAELTLAAAAVALGVGEELDEGATISDGSREVCKDLAVPGRELAVHDAHGVPLAGDWADLRTASATGASAATVARAGEHWRVRVEPHTHGGQTFQVIAAQPLAGARAAQGLLRRTLLVGIPLALALAAAGGFWIARRALFPLGSMADEAGRITDRTPGVRLRAPREDDEIGRLARAFNGLLERLEGTLAAQRRFMADASHELRTPVSIVRTAADVTLEREARSEAEYRESLAIVSEQGRRLARMVEDMMVLARADAFGLQLEPRELYLDEVVEGAVRSASVLAAERNVQIRGDHATEVPFRGDERLLGQALLNLLDNAIRHSPPGGRVDARLAAADGWAEIAVSDTGGGIPPEEQTRIFERFVRLDPARARPGGAGLGLPIARCIAEAHGGTVTLGSSDASGSTFLIRIPRQHA